MKRTLASLAVIAGLALAGCGASASGPTSSRSPTQPSDQQQLRQLDTSMRTAWAAHDAGKVCSYFTPAAQAQLASIERQGDCAAAMRLSFGQQPTLPAPRTITVTGAKATITSADGTRLTAIKQDGRWLENFS